ncbi:CatB-related O-acetyltransferase [Vibrio parahaemolyticus]|uniref:CatB-related O-acetyltransferase n=1 Tax=Vibrio parahaemolyticus TaxID=670 RepID=UPI001A8D49F8|nr:CatB-related O-acetyltransferase [Vibrio parahaemolyticus]EJB8540145.1 CatB-related O-acetyltransferase [Vibrio parahaemolyticus]MBO0186764.1 CatB-related O-acetyltransferase [Vibrio parahaemolyticus]MBO0218257.1 CatB-related O-acetyltransferase [Vibrio parahaemolyticus]MBY4624007.1 CatB-related O-acetyltransferase [Vibrio parahaemolyticus]MCR9736834.1 CatB-related O-acetyltransferase [Vibrio parahaemolyticus]
MIDVTAYILSKIKQAYYTSVIGYKNNRINIPVGDGTYGPKPKLIGPTDTVLRLSKGSSIGKYCSIAPGLQFLFRGKHNTNWVSTYPFRTVFDLDIPLNDLPPVEPIIIGNDVWIASNVSIMQGVKIGDGAVIAQNSLVTKNVPPYSLVGGSPAKIIKYRFTETQISELVRLKWWDLPKESIANLAQYLASDDIEQCITMISKLIDSNEKQE